MIGFKTNEASVTVKGQRSSVIAREKRGNHYYNARE
jgi:hypothetical protein